MEAAFSKKIVEAMYAKNTFAAHMAGKLWDTAQSGCPKKNRLSLEPGDVQNVLLRLITDYLYDAAAARGIQELNFTCFQVVTSSHNFPLDKQQALAVIAFMECQACNTECRKFGKHRNGLQRFRCPICA